MFPAPVIHRYRPFTGLGDQGRHSAIRAEPRAPDTVEYTFPGLPVDTYAVFSLGQVNDSSHPLTIRAGVKPIVGVDLRILNEDDPERPHTLLLLCQAKILLHGSTDRVYQRLVAEILKPGFCNVFL